jgi:3-hydroxyacyl-CoA dehydrogenase
MARKAAIIGGGVIGGGWAAGLIMEKRALGAK